MGIEFYKENKRNKLSRKLKLIVKIETFSLFSKNQFDKFPCVRIMSYLPVEVESFCFSTNFGMNCWKLPKISDIPTFLSGPPRQGIKSYYGIMIINDGILPILLTFFTKQPQKTFFHIFREFQCFAGRNLPAFLTLKFPSAQPKAHPMVRSVF